MSYVIKNGDRYVDINGQYRSGLENARRYDTLAEATLSVQAAKIFGEYVVDTNGPDAMTTLRDQVAEFHAMIGEPAPERPLANPPYSLLDQRYDFINSERCELSDALENSDLVEFVDALADIAYFVEGTFQRLGIDSGPILAEVHRSNMAKRGAGKDANGKWRKPAGWKAPDIAGELRRQGWKGEK